MTVLLKLGVIVALAVAILCCSTFRSILHEFIVFEIHRDTFKIKRVYDNNLSSASRTWL